MLKWILFEYVFPQKFLPNITPCFAPCNNQRVIRTRVSTKTYDFDSWRDSEFHSHLIWLASFSLLFWFASTSSTSVLNDPNTGKYWEFTPESIRTNYLNLHQAIITPCFAPCNNQRRICTRVSTKSLVIDSWQDSEFITF